MRITFCRIPIQEIGLLYRCRLVMIACLSIIWSLGCVTLRSQALRLIYFRGERYHPERFDEIIFLFIKPPRRYADMRTLHNKRQYTVPGTVELCPEEGVRGGGIFYLVILTRWSNKSFLTYFWTTTYKLWSPIKRRMSRNVYPPSCTQITHFVGIFRLHNMCGTSAQCWLYKPPLPLQRRSKWYYMELWRKITAFYCFLWVDI